MDLGGGDLLEGEMSIQDTFRKKKKAVFAEPPKQLD
jgi:hypothetical protein